MSQNKTETATRRVADALHDGIDQAAEKSEQWERSLHEKSRQAQEKSQELNGSVKQMMQDRPWTVVGGAVALGVLIGALTRK